MVDASLGLGDAPAMNAEAGGTIRDALAERVMALGDHPEIVAILAEICEATGMGFAAVARVTEDRWIACQVLDRIEFGLNPGDELEIKMTICNDIRQSGQRVIIDQVALDQQWRTHPIPRMYGFKSYASLPVVLADGSFFGTLCAIDTQPRTVSAPETIALLERCAARMGEILFREGALDI